MQNCNLASSLQFLRLHTHLTSVKSDCNGFAVVTVVNLMESYLLKNNRSTFFVNFASRPCNFGVKLSVLKITQLV